MLRCFTRPLTSREIFRQEAQPDQVVWLILLDNASRGNVELTKADVENAALHAPKYVWGEIISLAMRRGIV